MIKKLMYTIALTAFFSALTWHMTERGWLENWEWTTWDWRVAVRSETSHATDDIKLIMVDEESLQWMAEEMRLPWPWPREVYSAILQFCARGGARSVAFDVLFLDHSFRDVQDDALFGQAIREGPPFVAAAYMGDPGGGFASWPPHVPDHSLNVGGLTSWLDSRSVPELQVGRASFPIPAVATNAVMIGDVKGVPDRDSIVRRTHLFRVFDERAVPALGLAAYMAAVSPERGGLPRMEWTGEAIRVAGRSIPIDEQGRSILKYRGPPGTHERYQAAEIIRNELKLQNGEQPDLSPIVFNNAYVLLGFSAPGLLDLRPTPVSPVTPGVEIHATLLDNYLADDFVRTLPDRWNLIFTAFLLVLATGAILFVGKAWKTVLVFVLVLPVPCAVGFFAYDFSLWWPVVPQTLALALSMVGAMVLNYALEGRQKQFIKGAFKHYLSPTVIEQIMEHPEQLTLGGERRLLSIFFSDLAGFSSISERLEPPELTQLLNDYLTDMTDIILDEGGTVDKFEGDAIIAFWNAPLTQGDHAVRAARAALRCQRRLAERRPSFKERTGVELYMRIGVNTGEVIVGNMGSRDRFDYTVLGDAANLAARLEGANKRFGTSTMVAESTWMEAKQELVGREIGTITVVGRTAPVRVFEVLGEKADGVSVPIAEFERAVSLCHEQQWRDALKLFEQWPEDPLSVHYAERCRALSAGEEAGWDGVWKLAEK